MKTSKALSKNIHVHAVFLSYSLSRIFSRQGKVRVGFPLLIRLIENDPILHRGSLFVILTLQQE